MTTELQETLEKLSARVNSMEGTIELMKKLIIAEKPVLPKQKEIKNADTILAHARQRFLDGNRLLKWGWWGMNSYANKGHLKYMVYDDGFTMYSVEMTTREVPKNVGDWLWGFLFKTKVDFEYISVNIEKDGQTSTLRLKNENYEGVVYLDVPLFISNVKITLTDEWNNLEFTPIMSMIDGGYRAYILEHRETYDVIKSL